jgi:hypothetical protein
VTTIFLDHPLLLSFGVLALLIANVEAGFRLAITTGVTVDEGRREQARSSRDVLGILLSLLLGFTLAMALPRFDLRRQLVMEEANAIGTTSLRVGVLPEAQRKEVRALLLEYVQARLAYSHASIGSQELKSATERSKNLQTGLWQKGEESARQSPTPMTALFVSSLNDTIDLSEKRLNALENRVPPTVWLMLVLIACLFCLTSGYAQSRRFWLTTIVSPLMIAIVMGFVADLDSSRSGFLRVDLQSLERLAQDLLAEPNQPPVAPSAVR